MYIIELIAKRLLKRKKTDKTESLEDEDYHCEHIYLAIDSTKEYLACNKCGHVIKNIAKENKPEEKRNIFKFF